MNCAHPSNPIKNKLKHEPQPETKEFATFWKACKLALGFYVIPGAVFGFITGTNMNINLFPYLVEITFGNIVGLFFIFSYPLIFCLTFFKFVNERQKS